MLDTNGRARKHNLLSGADKVIINNSLLPNRLWWNSWRSTHCSLNTEQEPSCR